MIALFVCISSSCNKDIVDKISFMSPDDVANQYSTKSYRVAYIVIDGAVGTVVGTEATDYNKMPFLASMTNKGLFSWNSIASNETQDVTFYADMLTGVDKSKHKVTSNDLSGSALTTYPLVFDRLKKELNVRTAVLTSNPAVDVLTKASTVDNKQFLSTDTEVVSEAKKELVKEDASFALITLNNVDKVGRESGYGPKSEAYLNALNLADNQIKEIVNTIESRANYKSEKWLIVVASNRGGNYEIDPALLDNSLYSVPFRNNFVLFYNNQFQYKIVQKMDLSDPSYDGTAARYTGTNARGVISASAATVYNIAENKEYTIQFKVKMHAFGQGYPVLMAKRSGITGSTAGWGFRIEDRNTKPTAKSGIRFIVMGKGVESDDVLDLDSWYTVTGRVYNQDGKRYINLFINGKAETPTELLTTDVGSNNEPLVLGSMANSGTQNPSYTITDVRFYDTALPVDYITSNYCQTAIYNDNMYWNNLIGYWRVTEDMGSKLVDKSKSKIDFSIEGTVAWNSFSDRSGNLCPTAPQDLAKSTIRSVDAPMLIYNWLGILGTEKFNLDSKVWAPSYSNN